MQQQSRIDEYLKLAKQKQSNEFIAERMGISLVELVDIKLEVISEYGSIKKALKTVPKTVKQQSKYFPPTDTDKQRITFTSERPLTTTEIIEMFQIDLKEWKLASLWNKEQSNGKFLVSANIVALKKDELDRENFTDKFTEFLSKYTPSKEKWHFSNARVLDVPSCSLILPKQDAHFNKYDIEGANNIEVRFRAIEESTKKMIHKASVLYKVEDIVYVIGSDQFNSEWTGLTTKGTPQQNILTYEGSFSLICEHEVRIIDMMLMGSSEVKVIYVPGNHDHYVGWHLIKWLETYYRNESRIKFDTSTLSRKYYSYGNSLVMLNHGYIMRHSQLRGVFPMECKDIWSQHENYYIFTGDKHHEKSEDIQGIKCYQIPQLSNAKSNWDDERGYGITKAEMTGFVLTLDNGMSDIFKEIL